MSTTVADAHVSKTARMEDWNSATDLFHQSKAALLIRACRTSLVGFARGGGWHAAEPGSVED